MTLEEEMEITPERRESAAPSIPDSAVKAEQDDDAEDKDEAIQVQLL